MLDTGLSPWPSFSEEEAEAVAAVLRSNRVNYWTGEEGRAFEREFARWVGTKYAVALMNGTVALDVALKALGVGPGSEVVVTPRSFIASASCVVNAGAKPVFADVDRDSGNISAATIEPVLSPATRAIIVVHLGGYPADMAPIMELADARGIKVIEDCAQAHGARSNGSSVGSIGHIGAWSFCQDKIMTTGGEGGMVTTNDEALWKAMWSMKDHGKSWDAVHRHDHAPGFRWLHEDFGTNGRMLEVQSVLGRIQLRRMADWTAARNANARRIREALEPLSGESGPVRLAPLVTATAETHAYYRAFRLAPLVTATAETHAYYRYYCYVRPDKLAAGWNRDRIIAEINSAGIPCLEGSCSEVYRERAFDRAGLQPPQRLPAAMELGETSLAFLVHPTLTADEIERTADVASKVLRAASLGER